MSLSQSSPNAEYSKNKRDNSSLKIQIISSNAEFSSILSGWQEFLLHRAEKYSFWQNPHEIFFLVNGGNWDTMKVILLWQDNQIVCVSPCVIREQSFTFQFGVFRIPGPRIRILKILDSDFVYAKGVDRSLCAQRIIRTFKDIKSEFDVIYLENIIEGSPIWEIFKKYGSFLGILLQKTTREPQVIRRQVLAPSYEDWLKTLRSKPRYNLKRRVRLLYDKFPGQVAFKRVTTAKDVNDFLDLLDEVFPKTWQAKTFGVRKRNTSGDIARLMDIAKKGWLRSYILLINQNPVAFILGYQYANVFEHAECGYDPEFSHFGVGSVLDFLMIKDLYDWDKPNVLNFGFGENEYKRILGNDEQTVYPAYLLFPGRWRYVIKLQLFLGMMAGRAKALSEKLGVDHYLRKILKRKK